MSETVKSEVTVGTPSPERLGSPFDLLMGQITTMRNRARKYAEEEEAVEAFDSADRCRSVEGTLNELLRLGESFKANTGREAR